MNTILKITSFYHSSPLSANKVYSISYGIVDIAWGYLRITEVGLGYLRIYGPFDFRGLRPESYQIYKNPATTVQVIESSQPVIRLSLNGHHYKPSDRGPLYESHVIDLFFDSSKN